MIEKVSAKWLDDVIMLHELGGIGSDHDHAAFCELRTRRAVEREQAAPEAVGRVIRLRKRPRWLRDLLASWELRACDLVAQGRAFDAEDLRAGAEEVRQAHDKRRQPAPTAPRLAKWERQMQRMNAALFAPGLSWKTDENANKWECQLRIGEDIKTFWADTAKAAVKASFKSWKESR